MVHNYPPRFNNALDSSSSNFSIFSNLLSCFIHNNYNKLTILKQSNIFSTTIGHVFPHGCLRNEKLLIASVGVKQLVASWKILNHCSNHPKEVSLNICLVKSRCRLFFWPGSACKLLTTTVSLFIATLMYEKFCLEYILLLLQFLSIIHQTHMHQLRHNLAPSAVAVAE